jgi:hypothetical protein
MIAVTTAATAVANAAVIAGEIEWRQHRMSLQ